MLPFEIIAEIERVTREVYCGPIGLNGHIDTKIAIRTATMDDDLPSS
ncbi:chorismate-binding protein [Bradyrhizobium sp. 200]|nr:chorismate-binding protein [Bradyrhizobium sp. 200]UPJ47972.1 chorismate-binding protein [Bradyrhizobium sp. 200]